MVLINEWLPNPPGRDERGEWIELWNKGSEAINLSGWKIENKSGGKFPLDSYIIAPQSPLLLHRSHTKLVLSNQDGELFLYDAQGTLIDSARFRGVAPEGKSFSRQGEIFALTTPTPGEENIFETHAGLMSNFYPLQRNFVSGVTTAEIFWLAIGVGVLLTMLTLFLLKRSHDLQNIFFGGDETPR